MTRNPDGRRMPMAPSAGSRLAALVLVAATASAARAQEWEAQAQLTAAELRDPAFSQGSDRRQSEWAAELELGLGLAPTPATRAQVLLTLLAERARPEPGTAGKTETGVEFDELWLEMLDEGDWERSLRLGRIEFTDEREWWWSESLDAVQLGFAGDGRRWLLALGGLLARRSTLEPLAESDRGLARLLLQGDLELAAGRRLSLFALGQHDSSGTPSLAALQRRDNDESDADLLWAGFSLADPRAFSAWPALGYRWDLALLDGRETLSEIDDESGADPQVVRSRADVSAWALDVELSLALGEAGPVATLGYARASGDDPATARNEAFRQTGLHANESSTKYYGYLFDPELSNLEIAWVGLQWPLSEEIFWGARLLGYRQVEPGEDFESEGIAAGAGGTDRALGSELDLFLIAGDWRGFELDLAASVFEAGAAFGTDRGERAHQLLLELTYEF